MKYHVSFLSLLHYLIQMMSDVRKFRTQPITGSDESFSFVVYGDMGITDVPGAHDTAKYMIKEAAEGCSFVFHIGDISYAVGFVSKTLQPHETIVVGSSSSDVFERRTSSRSGVFALVGLDFE